MSSEGVFILVATGWILEGVAEIPTGTLADIFGRRWSVTVSFALRAVGYGALCPSSPREPRVPWRLSPPCC